MLKLPVQDEVAVVRHDRTLEVEQTHVFQKTAAPLRGQTYPNVLNGQDVS